MEAAFLLKKLLGILLMPMPIGVFLLIGALYFLHKERYRYAKITLGTAILWLFVFSYLPFANAFMAHFEHTYPTLETAPKDTRYIYVLGYAHETNSDLPITSQVDKEAVVRLAEGIRLYRQLDGNATLIVSGYKGLDDPTPHALMQRRLAKALGIPAEKIIVRPTPKDTQEEAQAAKEIIGDAPFILVTSAYHMPRAMRWFERAELHPTPAPTYHLAHTQHPHYRKIFNAEALRLSTIAFHELLGTLWQRIR